MNNQFKKILFLLLMLTIFSCDEVYDEEQELTLTYQERINNLDKLNNLYLKYGKSKSSSKIALEYSKKQENDLIESIVVDTKHIFNTIGFTEEDVNEIIEENNANVSVDDIYVGFGLAIISSYNNSELYKSNTYMSKGDFVHCLKEATGINALATLGNAALKVYLGEVSGSLAVDAAAAAAVRKAAIKAAGQILVKFGGGIGGIIMVVQFVKCMDS